MKKLLFSILAMFMVTTAFSQELRVNTVDEFTKVTKKITKTYPLARGVTTIRGYVGHLGEAHAIYLYSSSDLGCSGAAGNYIIFLFEDGSSLKLDNDIAKIDCAASSTSIYMFKPEDFEGKKISKIRFAQSKAYDDCVWDGEFTLLQLIEATK